LPGISGFGAAAKVAVAGLAGQAAYRDAVAERLKATGSAVMGEAAPRLPNTLCIAAPGFTSDLQVMGLDLAGVMVSAGSACSSGKVKASPVLEAMGQGELAACAIRVSGGWDTTQADWNRFADAWLEAHARHMARRKEVA
jgi:cysteine desulfurase